MLRKFIFTFFSLGIVFSCSREAAVPEAVDGGDAVAVKDTGYYVPGVAVVYLSEDLADEIEEDLAAGSLKTKSSALNDMIADLGIESMTRVFPYAGEYEPRTRAEGLHRWYEIRYAEGNALTKAQTDLSSVPGIESVNGRRRIKSTDFNDFSVDRQWHYYSPNSKINVNVKPVWDNYTTGNPAVVVAVVDGGIDLTHEDLRYNVATSGHHNFVRGNSYITAEDHGTHVAGTIGAVNNNGKGGCGIAGGDYAAGKQGVTLLSCQIFEGNSSAGGASAIKYAADHGAVISQNSWGYSYDSNNDGQLTGGELQAALAATIQPDDKAAIDYFIKYAGVDASGNQKADSPMKGGVVIFAAGNDGIRNGAPANYEPVIAVGSVSRNGGRATYSNYGSWVDICAPGTEIYSTYPDNSYGLMSGTSMACPHVSGVAALVLSYAGGPEFTNKQLEAKLLEGANSSAVSSSAQIGPLADALGSIVYGQDNPPAAVKDLQGAARSNFIDLEWSSTTDKDGNYAYGYCALYGKDSDALKKSEPSNLVAGVSQKSVTVADASAQKQAMSISDLDFGKEYFVKIYAFSAGRNFSEASSVIAVTTLSNSAPVITTSYDGNWIFKAFETPSIPFEVSDPDGHTVSVKYTSATSADSFTGSGNAYSLSIDGPAINAGTYTSKITASDQYGASATRTINFTILENNPPIKVKDIDNQFFTTRGMEFTLDMDTYFSDPDGEQLTYSASIADPTVAHLAQNGNQLIGTILKYGSTAVTVTATDAKGATVSTSFMLLARPSSTKYQLYPNPVKTTLNVATGQDKEDSHVKVVSATGQTVYDGSVNASAFEPARIDFSGFAPGRYSVTVIVDGKEYTENIVKK